MELTHISKTVLEKRYLRLKQDGSKETPHEMLLRVASTIAAEDRKWNRSADQIQALQQEFYDLMDRQDFMPNSPTFTGAGTPIGQLSACFVLPVGDSLPEIYETMKQAALIHQTGGGTGFAFSRLRPAGDAVRSSQGVASGPVSFLKVYNASTEAVKQGGTRRGANMGILRVDHPDIMEFIACKEDLTQITNFNISIGITDAFMAALEAGTDYDLLNPRNGQPVGHQSAKDVWEKLVNCAWTTGEPGIVFIDRMNRRNPNNHAEVIEATNPCFHPETRIATERGLERIADLYARSADGLVQVATDDRVWNQVTVINGRPYRVPGVTMRPARVLRTGTKQSVEVKLANGQRLKVTPDHRLLTVDGWKEAGELNPGDEVLIQSGPGLWAPVDEIGVELGHLLGWLTGDGWLTKEGRAGLVFGACDAELIPYFQQLVARFDGGDRKVYERENGTFNLFFQRKALLNRLEALGVRRVRAHEKRVPEAIFEASEATVRAFLDALFSADGTVNYVDENHRDVRLTSASEELLQDVQLLLLNWGISSTIYNRGKQGTIGFIYRTLDGEDREYQSRGYFELIMTGDDVLRFKESVGISLASRKAELLGQIARKSRKSTKFTAKVVAVEPAETIDVYDIQEFTTHSLIANGVVAHNCGEQPLPPYGSCNLGSINLANFVIEPYTQNARVDWDRLAEVTHLTTHFLDNVIDANKYPLEQLAEKARRDRRIGLGVMGWAEMLVQLGLGYDSEEGCAKASEVMTFIKKESAVMSGHLAEERGVYPEWEGSQWAQAGLKVRNATLTTVAPTGTISIIAARPEMPVSGGCEPKFALVFTRNQAGSIMLDVDGQFEAVAKAEGWYSEELMQEIAAKGSCRGVDGVPEQWQKVFVVANEIEPYWHVRMQAAFQGGDETDVLTQPLDAACSKTINFANEATVEEVREAYDLAWKLGLKGITVYRDGSRWGQVLTVGKTEEKKEEAVDAPAPALTGPALSPRPTEAAGKMFVIPTHFGKMTLDVHMDDEGAPFEIIVNVGAAGSDLMADAVGMGMLVSKLLRLRSDVPVRERIEIVVDTLKNIGGSGSYGFGPNRVTSLASAIAKGLQRFLAWKESSGSMVVSLNAGHAEDHHASHLPVMAGAEKDVHVDPCPECGSHALAVGEGCVTCHNCGYSKCS
ncbi:MAG TPA: LAGLIDADG family homing endonuclease [Symbiobacteriaceae bacterium]|nr:LAGLIDADG family homing endonuclease [Symbiobacteriaceae bacterium]